MILESIRVRNFRSIKDATLCCDRLTVLVGANGSGKSVFLKAIEMFGDNKANVTEKDYYENNTKDEMSVLATFGSLSDEATEEFSAYIHDGKLVVKCVFVWDSDAGKGNPAFSSDRYTNPDFVSVRTADTAKEVKAEYKKLITDTKYDFPDLNTQKEIIEYLDAWDGKHPDRCTEIVADGGKFQAKWKRRDRFVRFVAVPAVHDAAKDVDDTKNSPINLVTTAVQQRVEGEKEYQEWLERARQDRTKVVQNVGQELKTVETGITENLERFAKGVKVGLSWRDESSDMNLPKIDVTLDEGGHGATVDRAGHGSQRAFIMAMLQTIEQMDGQAQAGSSTLILSIEEPELYQHPIRQRYISAMLDSLAGSADHKIQIIYTTHSPHFVGIDKLDHVRLLRKTAVTPQGTRATEVHKTSIRQLLKNLEKINVKKSEKFMEERLKVIMTPWLNEGFFAEMVVLVEGAIDYAGIMGMSRLRKDEFEALEVSVIPCGGIYNMVEPYVIFKELKIPTYVVSDLDNKQVDGKKSPSKEYWIHRLLGARPSSTQITDDFACFDVDLEGAMKDDMSEELYNELVDEQKERFGIKSDRKSALGKSQIMYEVLKRAKERKKPCETLAEIVKKISAMASRT